MNSLNVKSGDTVLVIAGKDAGKQGKVLTVNTKAKRVVVAGVNIVSKHQKARKAQDKSEIVKTEGAIDVSNVMVVCPTCGKPTRLKHGTGENGKSIRVCKCGAPLDKKYVKETKKASKKADAEAKAVKAQEKAKADTADAQVKKTVEKKVKATATNKETKVAGTRKNSQRGV